MFGESTEQTTLDRYDYKMLKKRGEVHRVFNAITHESVQAYLTNIRIACMHGLERTQQLIANHYN